MKPTQLFVFRSRPFSREIVTGLVASLLVSAAWTVPAQSPTYPPMYRPNGLTEGGVNPHPWITSIVKQGTNTTVKWYGLEGTYQLQMSPKLVPAAWSNVASMTVSDYSNSVTLPNLTGSMNVFRMNANNGYAGTGGCMGCHPDMYAEWKTTRHSTAYSTIANMPPAVRKGCIPCHTVGYGQPSGFTDITNTPYLTDVGCETCHGMGAAHKYGDHDLVKPAITIAAEVCGGCHTDAHHPTFDEWEQSGHGEVTPELQTEFADPVGGQARQMSCGPCHSGAVRLAMLGNYKAAQAGFPSILTLPAASDAAHYGPTCVVCHDPHSETVNPQQLRNPIFSTNFYSFFNGAAAATNGNGQIYYLNTVFSTQYVASVQMCAQCHNQRGALWTGTSRPPHHSPQYNILIGNIGTLNANSMTGPHGLRNTNQCVQCHMAQETPETITDNTPVYTGHEFNVHLSGCVQSGCHSSTNIAHNILVGTQIDTTNAITDVTKLLNQWGATKSPLVLRTNYGQYSWEYTSAGTLSSPTPSGTTTNGPSTARQASIPEAIKKARFYLYMASYDQSLGAHNGEYTRFLLNTAKTNVQFELNKP